MGLEYELTSTTLLCLEDSDSLLGSTDDENCEKGDTKAEIHQYGIFPENNSLTDFSLQSEEYLKLLILNESNHMPKDDYSSSLQNGGLDSSVRTGAVDWIWKVLFVKENHLIEIGISLLLLVSRTDAVVHAHYSFGPLTVYLAVNYLDRFLSCYELPLGKEWMSQLLSVACLSLAAKVEETEVPLSLDLQAIKSIYKFDARTVQRMELLVLTTLDWKMLPATPFSFIYHFLHIFNGCKPPPSLSISKSSELILNTIKSIEFLTFTPSEIAAAVAVSVLGDSRVLSSGFLVSQERVITCSVMIGSMSLMNGGFMPQSPMAVLDAECFSYKSNDAIRSDS